jgi:uncharacterized BrkB/YihY/UPF0761 family membrane protein
MGNQSYSQQHYEPPLEAPTSAFDDDFADAVAERVVQRLRMDSANKIYPQPQQHDKNVLRAILAIVSILLLLPFAFLFVIMVGGTTGWLSFSVACLTIFIIAVVAIDKVK